MEKKKRQHAPPQKDVLILEPRSGLPRYIRLPKEKELCRYSCLSRGKLRELIEGENPAVKSIVLPNKSSNQKGVRLIILESLMTYLRSLESGKAA